VAAESKEISADDESAKKLDEEVLKLSRERFKIAQDAESEIRDLALEDLKFAAGDQWPERIKKSRHDDNRPCLTINRLPQFIRQVTNDQRQNRPAINVSPVDDVGDVDTAKVLKGIVRHIEYTSDADTAYDTAFQSAVTGGFGYYRVVTEYADPYSFEQEIRIKAIRNPFSVYLDPSHECPAGSDANWGFIFTDLSRDEYKQAYPKSELASIQWADAEQSAPEWIEKDQVRIAEYFYKEFEEKTFVLLSDKSVVEKSQLPDGFDESLIVSERTSQIQKVCWIKHNGIEVLEKTDWPGQWIPIVKVIGEELIVDGKRILVSLIRHSKDAQQMLNYWKSAETEAIALAPKAPWVAAEGQIEGYEHIWNTSNVKNHTVLPYKMVDLNGTPAPPPQRMAVEPAVQAITQAAMLSADDLKGTMGIYDAALGARSNEQSGIAIQRRNIQAQTSNFHFVDNLAKSIRHTGRILVDLIPHIYDTERAVRILGEDGSEEIVRVNVDPETLEGGQKPNHLSAGKYDVTVSTGPSYETKRQESLATMLELSKSVPVIGQVAPDLLIKAMDFPMAQELAERVKKTLPPNITDDGKKQNQIPPELQAQLEQMTGVIEKLTAENAEHVKLAETKTAEMLSKERIEMAKLETQLRIELAKIDAQDARTLLQAEIAQLESRQAQLLNQEQQELDAMAGGNEAALLDQQQMPTGEQYPPGYESMEQMP
jgi:hypothetical protein